MSSNLSISSVVIAGGTVSFDVRVVADPIASFSLSFGYNLAEVVSTPGAFTVSGPPGWFVFSNASTPGVLTVGGASIGSLPAGSTLLHVSMTLVSPSDTEVGLSYQGSYNDVSVPLSVVSLVQSGNVAPLLTAPAAIVYTDTPNDDVFGTANGSLIASDANSDPLSFGIVGGTDNGTTVSRVGTFGTLTVDKQTGAYSYVPVDAAIEALKIAASESFTVTVSDGVATTSATLAVQLNGVNDLTTFGGAAAATLQEDGPTAVASGTLTASDREAGDAAIVAQGVTNGIYGSFTIGANGLWSYTLNNAAPAVQALAGGQSVLENFSVATTGGSVTNVAITVQGTNDAPNATNLSTPETYAEGMPLNLSDIVVSDVDTASVAVTLALSLPAAGTLSTGTSGGVTSSYTALTGVWTASGPIAQVNALLASVVFTPAPDYSGTFSVATGVSDGVATINGLKTFTGIGANDAPLALNLSAPETYVEDTPLNLTDIVVSDADGAAAVITASLTLSNPAAGALSTATFGGVTSSFDAASGVWSASGPLAQVNVLLAGVVFTPAANFNGAFTVATQVSDGIAPPLTGVKAFTGTPVNDAPLGSLAIDGSPVLGQALLAVNTLTDADGINGPVALQWLADGTPIVGADAIAYTPTAQDLGRALSVRASYVDGGGSNESVTSAATSPVLPPDTAAPQLLTRSPTDGATDVATGGDIVLSYSEPLVAGTGLVALRTAGGAAVEYFAMGSSSGLRVEGNQLVIDPTADLVAGTAYRIQLPAGVVKDVWDNPAAALSDYGFRTARTSVDGTDGPDVMPGTLEGQVMRGLAGDDILSGLGGDDVLDGGEGLDRAFYVGPRAQYELVRSGAAWTATDSLGLEGEDELRAIERLQFADGFLALDLAPTEHAGQTAALFGVLAPEWLRDRPDLVGAVLGLADSGLDLYDLCHLAVDSGVVSLLAGGSADADVARMAYRNVLGAEPDAAMVDLLTSYMDGRAASYSQADFLTIVAGLEINLAHIDLVGLQQTGLAYLA